MPSTPIHHDDHGYLHESRRQVLRSLEGLEEYQVRRPMTATGTNLLGVVKHLIGIEAGYLGLCLQRPFPRALPWIDAQAAAANSDMWATIDESRAYIVDLYEQACAHSDRVLAEVGSGHPASVPWWPERSRSTTAGALLSRVLKDTATHAGQLQILRELIDGQAGDDRSEHDEAWWTEYRQHLEAVARHFSP
ncbi:DinB family protein [Desertihabitans brevis]|uniref:DinB family protein n=1 Tax=Desertihabitans brevis TaxID=2268447 RepID=A0A367YS75_9ACTN|nr:DinB family protein [Desertihabitans brevis]RCK68650.1 DinB family protein [Desertihabitans brevis]